MHNIVLRITSALIQAVGIRVLLAVSEKRTVRGIELVNATYTPQHEAEAKLESSLRLIESTSAWRLSRLRRYLKRIILTTAAGPEYVHAGRGCLLNIPDVLSRSDAHLAATLIHESVHGRVRRARIKYVTGYRQRVEALCVRSELAFLRQLPDQRDLILQTEKKLHLRWWEHKALAPRRLSELRELGWPNWAIKVRARLFRKRGRG